VTAASKPWLPAEVLQLLKAQRSLIPCRLDKRPAISEWKPFQSRRPTGAEFTAWVALKPAAWAQVCGEISGIVTLDFDGEAGAETMRQLGLSPHRRTPSGGFHVDVSYPGEHVPTLNAKAKRALGERWPGMDIRADGGYAIVAGKIAAGAYEWLRPIEPDAPSVLPDEVWAFLCGEEEERGGSPPLREERHRPEGDRNRLADAIIRRALADAPSMGRNSAGFAAALQARDNGFSEAEALDLLRDFGARAPGHNLKGQVEPYAEAEQLASVREAYARPPRDPWPERPYSRQNGATPPALGDVGGTDEADAPRFRRTDLGNSEAIAHIYGAALRFDHKRGRWLEWAGDWWREDDAETVIQLAGAAARRRYRAAEQIGDADERKREATWAIQSESRGRIDAALALARSHPALADRGDGWDADPDLFGVPNGVLDLRTGQLRPGRREDRITKHAPVIYDPDATSPTFDAFLERVQPDAEMRAYLQRRAGYALTGDTSEQDLLFHHGGGANGKTTFANALMDAMGPDYARQAAPGLLLRSYGEKHPTELADLDGARLIVSTEVDDGRALAEELVKQLTGGDRLKARRMRQDFYGFEATFKLMLLANHRPAIKGTDWAIWRRIKLVPWNVTIPPTERDSRLREKLRAEAPGILAWAVRGCLDWRANGMQEPEGVTAATEAYRAESDPLSAFLGDCCVIGDRYTAAAGALFKAYQEWAGEQGIGERDPARLTSTAFGKAVGERFRRTRIGKRQTRSYLGLGLRDEHQPALEPENGAVEAEKADAFGPRQTRFESEPSKIPVNPIEDGLAGTNLENASNASACLPAEAEPDLRSCQRCGEPVMDADLCAACEAGVGA
jgi:putative DNA primase/helicase